MRSMCCCCRSLQGQQQGAGKGERLNMDVERVARSPEEMAAEAAQFRRWMAETEVALSHET